MHHICSPQGSLSIEPCETRIQSRGVELINPFFLNETDLNRYSIVGAI